MSSAIRSLVLTAQQHGVELNFDRLLHENALKETQEPDARVLCSIASRNNLKAKQITAQWHDLKNMDGAYPVIAQLKNKRYVVVVGFNKEDETVSVLDPSSAEAKLLKFEKNKFVKAWASRLILVRSHFQIVDDEQPFSLRWVFREFYTQKLLFTQTIAIALLLHIFAVIPIIYIMIVLDKVVNFEAYSTLYVVSIGVVIAHLLGGVLGYMKQYISLFFVSKLEARINMKAFESLMNQPLGYFYSNSSGGLVKTVQQVAAVRHFIVGKIFGTLLDATALLIYVPILILFSPALFVVVLLFALMISFNNLWSTKRQKDLIKQANTFDNMKQATLSNAISGIETVKTLALENSLKKDWEKHSVSHTLANLEEGKKSALSSQVSSTLQQLMTVAVIVIGVLMVFEGNLSPGVLIGVHMLAGKITGPLVQLVSMSAEFNKFSTAVSLLSDVINHKGENKRGGISPNIEGNIEFRNVSFGYTEDKTLIKNLSFKIAAKQKVALVGPSGSGKSTILRLAQGLLQAKSGTIFIDDHDIRVIDKEHLRTNVSMIGGQNTFFSDTIRANILLTMPTASRERLHWALTMSGLIDDLANLPQGMETNVEEGGTNLPKSMLQKIALARALIRNPKVLLMYDVMTGLSLDDEISLQKNMSEINKGRTLVLVTHHLSQTAQFDHILVMGEDGNLLEQGSHKHLLENGGWYADHWRKEQQLRGASVDGTSLQHAPQQTEVKKESATAPHPISTHKDTHKPVEQDSRINIQVASTNTSTSNKPALSKHLDEQSEPAPSIPTHAKTQSLDSLKLKELGERLQRNNEQAQQAKLAAEAPSSDQHQEPEKNQTKQQNDSRITNNKSAKHLADTEANARHKPAQKGQTDMTEQEKNLSSFIEGYLKHD